MDNVCACLEVLLIVLVTRELRRYFLMGASAGGLGSTKHESSKLYLLGVGALAGVNVEEN